ncbi:hypothetical protein F5Y12DRAFT_739414 [Xylaria sp. FL1777]|nr:hypothetical protein F5Y12DRAFT_739414 [Xylaria sp. FL1777]
MCRPRRAKAQTVGITVVNDVGLDPTRCRSLMHYQDYLHAIKTTSEVDRTGGKVRGFKSTHNYCGLQRAENSDPLRLRATFGAAVRQGAAYRRSTLVLV